MSNEKTQSLGEIIKKGLKEKGLNQSAVAKKMNVSKQVINQIDRRKTFDLDFLQKLKEVTGLDYTMYTSQNLVQVNSDTADLLHVDRLVEMSLAIKLKADPFHINKMGDLLISIKKEATRLGFTIL